MHTGTVTRWWTANGQGIGIQAGAEDTDRKYLFDEEIVILFQGPFVCLGEAHAQLLGGVGLVELQRNHRKLEPAKQPQKRLSGGVDLLCDLGFKHSLEGFGIVGVRSKSCTNLRDIPVQVCLNRPKGGRTEDVCGTNDGEASEGYAQRQRMERAYRTS